VSQRTERVEDLLRGELAIILQREMQDPRVHLATVSGLTVSRDLSHATVRISVLGEDTQREECLAALVKAKGYIRSLLARRVRLRTVPHLDFSLDRGAEHSQRISEILEGLDVDVDGS